MVKAAINSLVLCTLGLFLTLHAFSAPPDILLLMPDQMRGDSLGIVGHPVVRTPNLDELANQGILFRRAYTTCPSCIPARHSLLTGQFPSTSGVVGYAGKRITSPTLPELLKRAGYSTRLVGRYMHQIPMNEAYGFEKEIRGSTYVGDDDYDNFLRKVCPGHRRHPGFGYQIRTILQRLGGTALAVGRASASHGLGH